MQRLSSVAPSAPRIALLIASTNDFNQNFLNKVIVVVLSCSFVRSFNRIPGTSKRNNRQFERLYFEISAQLRRTYKPISGASKALRKRRSPSSRTWNYNLYVMQLIQSWRQFWRLYAWINGKMLTNAGQEANTAVTKAPSQNGHRSSWTLKSVKISLKLVIQLYAIGVRALKPTFTLFDEQLT